MKWFLCASALCIAALLASRSHDEKSILGSEGYRFTIYRCVDGEAALVCPSFIQSHQLYPTMEECFAGADERLKLAPPGYYKTECRNEREA